MTLLEWDERVSAAAHAYTSDLPSAQSFFLIAGAVPVYAVPVGLAWLFWRNQGTDRVVAVKIFVSAIVAWQVLSNAIGTFLYSTYGFRDRPFAPVSSGEFFFERPEKAFPSDHASVLGVVTMMLFAAGYRKLAWVFVVLTFVTMVGRVGVGYHYLGDMLGGLAVAALTFAMMRLIDKPLDRALKGISFLNARVKAG